MDLRSNVAPPSLARITMFLNALAIAKLYCWSCSKGNVYDVSNVLDNNNSSKDNGDAGGVGQQHAAEIRQRSQWERWRDKLHPRHNIACLGLPSPPPDWQTDRQTEVQTDKHTDRQIRSQTGKETDKDRKSGTREVSPSAQYHPQLALPDLRSPCEIESPCEIGIENHTVRLQNIQEAISKCSVTKPPKSLIWIKIIFWSRFLFQICVPPPWSSEVLLTWKRVIWSAASPWATTRWRLVTRGTTTRRSRCTRRPGTWGSSPPLASLSPSPTSPSASGLGEKMAKWIQRLDL